MVSIEIANEQQAVPVDAGQLQKTIQHVLHACDVQEGTVSIAVVEDTAIGMLQQKYYGTAEKTDVLSFNVRMETEPPPQEPFLDCEVVVNAQQAQRVSQENNQDAQAELNLYVVHGLLHQLGYDDQEPDQAERMHQKEDQLLEELGFGPVYSRGERR